VVIDQSPAGRSTRSNPATYMGVFTDIRNEMAKSLQVKPSLFSFNAEGACPKCKGLGTIAYEMHFLDEVKVTCDECNGKRYKDEVLALRYGGKDIHEILTTTIDGLAGFFQSSKTRHKLQVLSDVGLGYLEIGQPLSTLSGGEAQRIKLASELHKKGNIYVMDEPSTGLHMADIERLMKIIRNLTERNNTVIVIEHNPDIIRQADWIIDLGPEGGSKGGEVLFEGTPARTMKCDRSYTGKYL
jgi:excinuclease ABC A subunit